MINITQCTDQCYADHMGNCTILNDYMPCNPSCPFYKPVGCKDWVRVGDYLYTPEEYAEKTQRANEVKHPCWRIKRSK